MEEKNFVKCSTMKGQLRIQKTIQNEIIDMKFSNYK